MLTGDKVDTAINIGHSCSLLNTDMRILRLCADDEEGNEEEDNNAPANSSKSSAGGNEKGSKRHSEEVVVVERTRLELDQSGVPSEASLRG